MSTNKKKGNFKILIAEDDKFISKALRDGLTRAGFEIVNVYNGNEALKKLKSEQFDLILLDVLMPEKNGLEVLKKVKKSKKLNKIPILVFSNLDSDNDIRKVKELGAEEYLTKADFTIKDIVAKINEYSNTAKQMKIYNKA
jgi:DNA-binding response OmpR family regulator